MCHTNPCCLSATSHALRVKMIGKPYAGKLHVRFDEGGTEMLAMTGTKLETADTAKVQPKANWARPLLYPAPCVPSSLQPTQCPVFSLQNHGGCRRHQHSIRRFAPSH